MACEIHLCLTPVSCLLRGTGQGRDGETHPGCFNWSCLSQFLIPSGSSCAVVVMTITTVQWTQSTDKPSTVDCISTIPHLLILPLICTMHYAKVRGLKKKASTCSYKKLGRFSQDNRGARLLKCFSSSRRFVFFLLQPLQSLRATNNFFSLILLSL